MAEPRLTPEELATILSWFPVPTKGTIAEDLHRMGAELEACWEERRVAVEALEEISRRAHVGAHMQGYLRWDCGACTALAALAKLRGEP